MHNPGCTTMLYKTNHPIISIYVYFMALGHLEFLSGRLHSCDCQQTFFEICLKQLAKCSTFIVCQAVCLYATIFRRYIRAIMGVIKEAAGRRFWWAFDRSRFWMIVLTKHTWWTLYRCVYCQTDGTHRVTHLNSKNTALITWFIWNNILGAHST